MEIAEVVVWVGDSRSRFIERALELETWGNYEGLFGLGKKLILEVDNQIKELKKNVNLYSVRENDERVVPLISLNHVLIYKKVYGSEVQLHILDIRRFY